MPLNMLVVVDVTTGKISGLFFQPNQEAQASNTKHRRMLMPLSLKRKK